MRKRIRICAASILMIWAVMLAACGNNYAYLVNSNIDLSSGEEKTTVFSSEISSEYNTVAITEIEKTSAEETVADKTASCVTNAADSATETIFCSSLRNVLNESGHNSEELENSGQCIAVAAEGFSCDVYFFEKEENKWSCISETNGIVGKNGVSGKSCEGDYRTPEGIFNLGFAFGTEKQSGLSVEYRQITEDSYWVDDPESVLYNTWQETSDISWNSAEHLIDYPESYKYAVVIDYNMNPVVPGAGSAIFLHCADGSYTAGCVAVPEEKMLEILRSLDKEKNPQIIIYNKLSNR